MIFVPRETRFFRHQVEAVMMKRCPRAVDPKKKTSYPWRFLSHKSEKGNVRLAYEVPIGYSIKDIFQEVDALSAACGSFVELENRGGAVIINIVLADFPQEIPYADDMLGITEGRSIVAGFDRSGVPVTHSFKIPHLLVAGMSGYGKTDFLRFLIFQLIQRFGDSMDIDIIDGKGFSFLPFRGIPNIRIVRDLSAASMIISEAKTEMIKRSNIVWGSNDRSITGGFRWRMIIIDELAQLSPAAQITRENVALAKRTYAEMASISCVGREAGIGLIMTTQRPDVNTIHPSVKANCDASICFRTKTLSNSEIVIDRGGAELLPAGKAGRGIYSSTTDRIFQTPYIGSDEKWFDLLSPYRKEVIPHAIIEESREPRADYDIDYDPQDLFDESRSDPL